MGETSINLAKDQELLELAARSGMRWVLVGLESASAEALKDMGKGFVKTEQVKELVGRFNALGIEVDSAFIFGMDEHDSSIFKNTYDYAKEIGLQSTHSVIMIPFPGTPVYRQLEQEGRLLTKDWSKYDGAHVVFEPKKMTSRELDEGAYWYYRRIGRIQRKLDRSTKLWTTPTVVASVVALVALAASWLSFAG